MTTSLVGFFFFWKGLISTEGASTIADTTGVPPAVISGTATFGTEWCGRCGGGFTILIGPTAPG